MKEKLIEQFVESSTIDAMHKLLESSDAKELSDMAVILADTFGAGKAFKAIVDDNENGETKLISSFHNNLMLLIQKTWVEKSDEDLKVQVINFLKDFTQQLESKNYAEAYASFFGIVDSVVYLMFGTQAKTKDFDEYALRIDPEFGIFWWYLQALPKNAQWEGNKYRITTLLGMYFLANY